MTVDFAIKSFYALTLDELYDVLKLRTDVFVVEQRCAYAELDGEDKNAMHLIGCCQNEMACYARIFAPKDSAVGCAKIGRVVVHPKYRGCAIAYQLMTTAMEYCDAQYGSDIRISAQAHLSQFYQNLGFQVIGAEYLEDGIAHIDMVRSQSFT